MQIILTSVKVVKRAEGIQTKIFAKKSKVISTANGITHQLMIHFRGVERVNTFSSESVQLSSRIKYDRQNLLNEI